MGQLILCKTKRAENPFFVESGKVNIYSLEELMYYVQSASFVTRDDFQNNEFIEWVRQELQLSELADILQKKLDEEVGLKDLPLVIFWNAQEARDKKQISVGEYCILPKKLFYELLELKYVSK